MLNKERFIEILSATMEIYNKELSELGIQMYYNTLKDYNTDTVMQAFNIAIKTNKYNVLPKPAEIIEIIEGSKEEKADIAWGSVIQAMRKHGHYASIDFEDTAISATINHLGGWQYLCGQTKEELHFIQKDFIRLYNAFSKRNNPRIKLPGFFEEKNLASGYEKDIPEVICVPKCDNGLKAIELK